MTATVWKFKLKVVAPDGETLQVISTRGSDYMDGSLVENSIYDLAYAAKQSLIRKGYLS